MLVEPQNPTRKSVVFHTLVFCPWHRDCILLGSHGLKILTWGPYWYIALASAPWYSDTCKQKIEPVQRSDTRVIYPDYHYSERLWLPKLNSYVFDLQSKHFSKIADRPEHPLFSQITRNNCTKILLPHKYEQYIHTRHCSDTETC